MYDPPPPNMNKMILVFVLMLLLILSLGWTSDQWVAGFKHNRVLFPY